MTRTPRGRAWAPIGLVFLLLFGLSACGGSDSTASTGGPRTPSGFDFGANEPQLVDAFGDSITEGFLEEGVITSNNYPNNLRNMLRGLDANWRVNNRGVGGQRVEQGARRLPGVLASDHPGFVLIMEGTNNADELDDPSFIVANLQEMVRTTRNNRSIPVLGTIPPNFRHVTLFPYIRATIEESNAMIRGMAAAEGVTLAEIFEGMNDEGLFGSPGGDPHHPNERGYQVMAGIWFDAMRRAIPTGPAAERARRGGTTQSSQPGKPAKRR